MLVGLYMRHSDWKMPLNPVHRHSAGGLSAGCRIRVCALISMVNLMDVRLIDIFVSSSKHHNGVIKTYLVCELENSHLTNVGIITVVWQSCRSSLG